MRHEIEEKRKRPGANRWRQAEKCPRTTKDRSRDDLLATAPFLEDARGAVNNLEGLIVPEYQA
jgi:hypothetical protein